MSSLEMEPTISAAVEAIKAPGAVNVAVNKLSDSDEVSSNQSRENDASILSSQQTLSSSIQITRLIETTRVVRRRVIKELDEVDEYFFDGINLDSYLNYISDERLFHMPRRGSSWDKILKAAEFFGLHIYNFGDSISHFVPESRSAAFAALGSCRLLLELGPNQSKSLESSFGVLYEFGLLISETIRTYDLKIANEAIKEDLGEIYAGLVDLVSNVAIYYRQRINSMTTKSVKFDFFGTFGSQIDRIYAKKAHLSNHMWMLKLRNRKHSLTIEALRHKLSPLEQSAKSLLLDRLTAVQLRVDPTCEWLQGHLLDFLRSEHDDMFIITGDAGFGKNILAGWIKERLQRPLGRKSYETLTYTFPFDAPAQATGLAFVKSMLSQILERNVGDVKFYEELVAAFEDYSDGKDAEKLENTLWSALEVGLKTVQSARVNLVIIVDGLDEIQGGGAAAKDLHHRLHSCIHEFSLTRAVTLSRPISHLGTGGARHLYITKDYTGDDVASVIKQTLADHPHFKDQSVGSRASFVESLVKRARGSLLWTSLVLKSIQMEHTHDGFINTAESASSDLAGLLSKLVGKVDFKNATTRAIFAILLVSERPLTVEELTELLRVNVPRKTLASESHDVRSHILSTSDLFIVERHGLVRFRHSSIRSFLIEQARAGKVLMSLKDAHAELTTRMLIYARLNLSKSYEPTFDGLSIEVIQETFRSNRAMEYIVRNWISHFRHSSLCGEKGEIVLPSHFKEIFPDSTFFAMLEWGCWKSRTSLTEVTGHHEFALRIRTAVFGENNHSVLQGLIIVGTYHRHMSRQVEAAGVFYRAARIGQSILAKFSTTVVACTSLFLASTETITITERTEIVTSREEMIRFIIEVNICQHGKSSDAVIRWYKVLAKLYIDIKEEFLATVIYRELHEIIIIRFGGGSKEARGISETFGGLMIELQKGSSEKDIVKYDEYMFETSEELEVWDELRISITIRLALSYEARGDFYLAELLFINLWRRISEVCRIKHTVEIHISKITIALEYIRFLQRINRIEEASNILICLWAEYEHTEFESELIIIRIKEIGCMFRSFGLLTVAISIFCKVWGFFKSKGKTTHEEAIETTVLVTEVIEEIAELKTTTTTTTVTTVTETVVREIFETTYTRCKTSKVDAQFFKACMTLIHLYIRQQKWSETEVIIKRSLEFTWTAFFSTHNVLKISGSFISELIILATQLAVCHHKRGHFEKAEEIYLRIYRACLISLHIDDIRIAEASLVLIRFYEEYHRHDKAIEIYAELLHGYRKHLGHSHKLVIKTLYALGSLCVLYGRKEGYKYYIEIVTTLNKGVHCHHDAFEAALILTRYYHDENRWIELQKICTVLWESFVHHHQDYHFTAEIIQVLYERYVYVLEFHAKVQFSVLYKLSVEYCETVTKMAGVTAAIVTVAMLALAMICEKHEKHYHEAVTIYEEVIKRTTTTTTTTTTTITTTEIVKKRLSKVYVKVITGSKTVTTTAVERAISICLEVYEQFKIEYGWWHETTLTQLKELVTLYKKLDQETTIIRLLQVSVIEIITKVTASLTLYHAATTLASIYLSVGMIKHGHELLHQLRHLIILHDIGSTEHITIKLGCKVTKVAFVFLAVFEQGLHEKITLSFSEIMADILTETFLFEQYTRVVKAETKIELVLQYGASLRCFWEVRCRKHNVKALDAKLFELFLSKYSSHPTVRREIVFVFYASLLSELGKERTKYDFATITCATSTAKVCALLEKEEFQEANEVANCAFQIISAHHFYQDTSRIHYGYKLAELLAGHGTKRTSNPKLRATMLDTSKLVLQAVLDAARAAKISFVALKFSDLAGLVALLGEQGSFVELEFLLTQLWTSREVQKTWSITTVVSIGTALVHARWNAGHCAEAIELCENICYNLRRSVGWLHPDALAASRLLASLYESSSKHREAMAVHAELLREVDEADEKDVDKKSAAGIANRQLEFLQRTYQRLGKWDNSERGYKDLYGRLKRFGLSGEAMEKWTAKGADGLGLYESPKEWKLEGEELFENGERKVRRPANPRNRASATWGCGQNRPQRELTL